MRQGRRIDFPEINPKRFNAVRKTGRIKAKPKMIISLSTKSRYSSNLTRFERLFGVNPKSIWTAFGKIK